MKQERNRPAQRASAIGVWRMFAASKTAVSASVIAGLIAGGGSAALLTLLTRVIEERGGASDDAIRFFLLGMIVLASSVISLALLSRVAQDNLFHLRLWLCRSILDAPLERVQALGAHRLMAALTSDVESVITAQETLPPMLIEGSKIIAVFAYLYTLSPSLLLLVAAYVLTSFLTVQKPIGWATQCLERARATENRLFNHFRAATEGGKELKMNSRRRRAFLDEEMAGTARALKSQRIRSLILFALIDRWIEALFYLLLGLLVFVAPTRLAEQSEVVTGFALGMLFLSGPLTFVGGWLPAVSKGVVALRNIEAMGLGLTGATKRSGEPSGAFAFDRPRLLELSGVTHHYPGENGEAGYSIGPVSLRIEPGELVFLTGGNGSGKTTLALLLLGLIAPHGGDIRLGGQRVTEADRESYRQNFSAVFADAHVFDGLLGYDNREAQERASDMLELLQLDQKLSIEHGRFSTIELSRGQRKRLALLTAYVEDRAFYLFDEWAAEQDPQFRDLFYRRLLPDLKKRGKTVIVITHDDRYFGYADRLFHMDCGRLEESTIEAI